MKNVRFHELENHAKNLLPTMKLVEIEQTQ